MGRRPPSDRSLWLSALACAGLALALSPAAAFAQGGQGGLTCRAAAKAASNSNLWEQHDSALGLWNAVAANSWATLGPRRLQLGEPLEGSLPATPGGFAKRTLLSPIPKRTGRIEVAVTEREGSDIPVRVLACVIRRNGAVHERGRYEFSGDDPGIPGLWTHDFKVNFQNTSGIFAVLFDPLLDVTGRNGFHYEVSYTPRPVRSPTGSVQGFADLHLHQFAAHGFGKLWYWSEARGPLEKKEVAHRGSELAEDGWPDHAFPSGLIGMLGDKEIDHGQPRPESLEGWPSYNDIAHQQAHARWLKRAHEGGLSLVVASMVNFQPACQVLKRVVHGGHGAGCGDMQAVRRQIRAAHRMAEQHDWYRIALDPWHARRIIRDGDLAVVLSMEVSNPFPHGGQFLRHLDHFWGMGLRSLQLAHETNSRFAGAAPHHQPIFAIFEELKHPSVPQLPESLTEALPVITQQPGFDRTPAGKNEVGLKPPGARLLDEMIDRHMLVDVAHLSERATRDVFDSLTSRYDYYPIYNSHTRPKGVLSDELREKQGEFLTTCEQAEFIAKTGGIVGLRTGLDSVVSAAGRPANTCHGSSRSYAQIVEYTENQTDLSVAFGTDLNGVAPVAGPRFGDESCPLNVGGDPGGQTVDPGHGGSAFHEVGLSHVGYLPDLLRDLDHLGAETKGLRSSAEAFLEMWERAYAENRSRASGADYCPFTNGTAVVAGRAAPDRRTSYTLAAEGRMRQAGGSVRGRGVTVNDNDEVSGREASGAVSRGADGFRFNGRLRTVDLADPTAAALYRDGERTRYLVIDGSPLPGGTGYAVEAADTLAQLQGPLNGHRARLHPGHGVTSGGTTKATGRVATGAAAFRVTGPLPTVRLTEPTRATVYVNGAEYHTIKIHGGGSSATSYSIRVDGSLRAVGSDLTGFYGGVEPGDRPASAPWNSVTGSVGGDADAFRVAGTIERITLSAPARDRVEVDGKTYHTLVVNGRRAPGSSSRYRFSVSGDLEPLPAGSVAGVDYGFNRARTDSVTGSTAAGAVSDRADGYWYTGEVTSWSTPGSSRAQVGILQDGIKLREKFPDGATKGSATVEELLNRPPLAQVIQETPAVPTTNPQCCGGGR